ncbi:hypothetical protein CK215_26740 [Mesorhizobium sp. WSM3864]|uniref:hypothetical protein n=1 Tax=Mesorhizobium sp. WSM3864 TaxID=2029404 RepID=UPI000BAEDC8D|nr:hypothetical protein [Mesorhizobium sp. WSM3864]PBB89635.1 hypothetical protein CK215_26740 [Mesorhizobium sp. WSM3864]
MRKGHFRVAVGGQDVTSRFVPRLISLSIIKSSTEATQSATFTLDDHDATVRFPKTGTPVSIELGWAGGAMRRFEVRSTTATGLLIAAPAACFPSPRARPA